MTAMTLTSSHGRTFAGAVVIIAAIVLGLVLGGGHLSSLIVLSSLGLVAAGPIAVSLMGFRQRGVPHGLALAFGRGLGGGLQSDGHRLAGLKLDSMANGAVVASLIGSACGCIHALSHLDKPEFIGPGIAVAFIATMYGLMMWLGLSATARQHKLRSGMLQDSGSSASSFDAVMAGYGGAMTLLFVTFVVLYAIKG